MHPSLKERMLPLIAMVLISCALAATVAHAATLQPRAYLPLIAKAPAPTATAVPTATPSGLLTAQEQETLDLINELRRDAGCSDLKAVSTLQNAAAAHNADMIANNFFGHTGSNDSTLGDRATEHGYKWSALGENIAAGQTSPESVVNSWKNSSGHYANIINCSYTDTGLSMKTSGGSATYSTYWTQDFGKPQ